MPVQIIIQSEGSYLDQGIEIKQYGAFGNVLSPQILSNSTKEISINGKKPEFSNRFRKDSPFYDEESLDFKKNQEGSKVEIEGMSRKDRIQFSTNHSIEKRDLGYPKFFADESPFEDIIQPDSAGYLIAQENKSVTIQQMLYPYVLDAKGPSDPGSYDGVIEAIPLRSWATRQNFDRPFSARRYRAAISNFHEEQFGTCEIIDQKINLIPTKTRNYLEFGDFLERPHNQKHGYFSEEPKNLFPFVEREISSFFAKKIDKEIAQIFLKKKDILGDIEKEYIFSTSGYTFLDSQNGTDSINYLDRKGI